METTEVMSSADRLLALLAEQEEYLNRIMELL